MRNILTVYQAAPGFERQLVDELRFAQVPVVWNRQGLLASSEPAFASAWAQNIWYEPEYIPISSITDGARRLRERQRNWALYPLAHHRRAALIQEKLPTHGRKPLSLASCAPAAPMGAWTLLEEGMILASAACRSAFANGIPNLDEDKVGPPSRAYLKLWEAFLVAGRFPQPGSLCLDLGSAPGGWTWLLAKLGCRVFSLDKAPLCERVAAMPLVSHCEKSSAFALRPQDAGSVDWLFSDVACYPARLYQLVSEWRDHKAARNMICTIKLQGETDWSSVELFRTLADSSLVHLHNNKHELTWISLA